MSGIYIKMFDTTYVNASLKSYLIRYGHKLVVPTWTPKGTTTDVSWDGLQIAWPLWWKGISLQIDLLGLGSNPKWMPTTWLGPCMKCWNRQLSVWHLDYAIWQSFAKFFPWYIDIDKNYGPNFYILPSCLSTIFHHSQAQGCTQPDVFDDGVIWEIPVTRFGQWILDHKSNVHVLKIWFFY